MNNHSVPSLISLIIILTGCTSNFTPQSEINGLRILAIQNEPPEVQPGESSTWSALVALPEGQGKILSWSLTQCTPSSQGGCLEMVEAQTVAGDEGAPQLYAMTSLRFGEVEIIGESGELTAPPMLAPMTILEGSDGVISSAEAQATFTLCEDCEIEDANIGLKRLKVSHAPDINLNPVLLELAWSLNGETGTVRHGDTLPLLAAQQLTLQAVLEDGSIQSYLSNDDEPEERQESLYIRWFASTGLFEGDRTSVAIEEGLESATVVYTTPTDWGANGIVDIHAVVWDQRGGADWITIHTSQE